LGGLEAPAAPPAPPAPSVAAAQTPAAAVRLAQLRSRLARSTSWTFALSDKAAAADLRGYSLVVVDGETTPALRVRRLRATGAVVLAYLSIGTIEDYRWWSDASRSYRLDRWADWGEWYADVNRPGFRALITTRVLPRILAAGFDGVFLDNVDMVESHPRQRSGMTSLVATVSRDVHLRGRLVLAQNGDGELPWLLPRLDGWNREDVSFTFDFAASRYRRTSPAERSHAARAIRMVRARRLTALTTDYLNDPAAPTAARQVTEAVRFACALGAKPYVGSIGLDRMPHRPLHC
jgi:uncharacterized protein (TIGR01370 family)